MRSVLKRAMTTTAALAMSASLFVAEKAGAENLADALIGAYNSSGLLEQNRALLRAADEDVAIAMARLRPVVTWTGRIQKDLRRTRSATGLLVEGNDAYFNNILTADWLVWDGGAAKLGKQIAQETVLATRQNLVSVEQEILFRAVQAYMNLLFNTENVSLRQNNLRVLQEELKASQDRFDVGEVTRTDVALAESRLAAARSSLAAARGALAQAEAEYANAVGRKPGTLAGTPKLPKRPASIAQAESIAKTNHPGILSMQHQISAAELGVMAQKAQMGPSVTLRGQVDLNEYSGGSQSTLGTGVGLNFSQTLYQGGAKAATLRKAIASRDSVRAGMISIQRDVTQGVVNAFARLDSARASLAASRERVRAAQIAFDGTREEATLGARTTLDVLTAEQELLDAKTAQIQARAEQEIAAYQLLVAQGLLTAERLDLAVQIYDPTMYYNLVKDAPAYTSKRSKDLDRVLKALGKQ